MNLNMVKEALPVLFKARVTPLLISHHGAGKTSTVTEFAKENNYEIVHLRIGQMSDSGDLAGLPDFLTVDGEKVATKFMSPDWFPRDPNSQGIIFLDEINRGRRDVLQAVFELILERRMHGKSLPANWHVVAAMNPDTEDYNVTSTDDKALLDRFCHIKVTSSYQDFTQYGEQKGFNKSVLSFISTHPAMLRGNLKDFNLDNVTPSDRSWENVSRVLQMYDNKEFSNEEMLNEIVSGIVGTEASVAYLSWKKNNEKPIDGEKVLSDYPSVQAIIKGQTHHSTYRSDLVNETKTQLLSILNGFKEKNIDLSDDQYKNLVAFMYDLPAELFADFSKLLLSKNSMLIKRLALGGELTKKVEECNLQKASTIKKEEVKEELSESAE